MAGQNGTLRLVAGNPEPAVGVAATPPVAFSTEFDAMNAELHKLDAIVLQLSNTALLNQLKSFEGALATYIRAVDSAMATPAPSPGQSVPLGDYLDAEKLVQQLKLELQKLGYTFTPSNQPIPPTSMTKPVAATPGTYTTGQVGSVGVAGALLGWVGHGLWEDYHKRHGGR
jgi:hypothetical protein